MFASNGFKVSIFQRVLHVLDLNLDESLICGHDTSMARPVGMQIENVYVIGWTQ